MASGKSLKAGKAILEFSLKDGKVRAQLKKLQKRFAAVGAGLQRLGGIALKAGATMAAGFVSPIKAASDLQETMGKFNTVFGSNSTVVKAWGDNFAKQVGRSKTQVAGFLAGMQDLFVPLGFAADEAEGLSKQVTTLAVDLASFNNMQDADTIRDLQAALTGSGEVMKKYGVIVSEAAVKQELLNQGLDPKAASNQAKVQARLNTIMAGTTAAQGDAIRTGGSFANMYKRAKGVAVDLAAAIGKPLLAPLASLLGMVSSVAEKVAAWVSKNTSLVRGLAMAGAAITAVGTAVFAIGAGFSLTSVVIGGLVAAATTVAGVLSAIGAAIGSVGVVAVAVIAPLLAVSATMAASSSGIWESVKTAFQNILDFVIPVVHTVQEAVTSAFSAIYEFVQPIVSSLLVGVQDAFTAIWKVTKTVWGGIVKVVTMAWDAVGGIVARSVGWMKKVILGSLSAISFAFNNWNLLLKAAVNSALLSVVKFSNQTVHMFGTVIPGYLKWFYENWRDVFTDVGTMTKTITSSI